MAKTKPYMQRTQLEWQSLFDEQQKSGLTQKDFCDQRKIKLQSFYTAKYRIGQLPVIALMPSSPTWVELPMPSSEEVVPQSGESGTGWDIELQLGADLFLRLRQR